MNILWDVDGTLTANDISSTNLYSDAIKTVFGESTVVPELPHHGKTDCQIIRESLDAADLPHDAETVVTVQLQKLSETYYRSVEGAPAPLLGAAAAVDVIRQMGHTNLLLTGNSRGRAELKLAGAGFDLRLFDWDRSGFGAYARTRPALAIITASELTGTSIVIGDTPGDAAAAAAGGFLFIGVTTGVFTAEDLSAYDPVAVLGCLEEEQESLVDLIAGLAAARV